MRGLPSAPREELGRMKGGRGGRVWEEEEEEEEDEERGRGCRRVRPGVEAIAVSRSSFSRLLEICRQASRTVSGDSWRTCLLLL